MILAAGPDPNLNGRLASIIDRAKSLNIPKVNIESAVKKVINCGLIIVRIYVVVLGFFSHWRFS